MISFELTEEQSLVRETVRKFAAEELRPVARTTERGGACPRELRGRAAELGLGLLDVPEAQGGAGLGLLGAALVHEELAFGDAGLAIAILGPHAAPAALVELGTPEQAARLLDRLAAPQARGAIAWSESGPGLPLGGFRTTARRDGDDWILDGEKAFVVNGGVAECVVVFAQDAGTTGWSGASAFVLDGRGEGATAGARCEWLGLEVVHAAPVRLAGVRVPGRDRLAGAGGFVVGAQRMFARIAIANAARQVGLARAAYESALAYTQDRVAFGKVVAHFQAVSFTLAELAMEVDAARWMVWRAAASFDAGAEGALLHAAQAAVQANDAAWRVADHGVQLLGGAGFVQDHLAEKRMRDTKTLALLGPSDQDHLVAASCALGLTEDAGAGLPISALQPAVT